MSIRIDENPKKEHRLVPSRSSIMIKVSLEMHAIESIDNHMNYQGHTYTYIFIQVVLRNIDQKKKKDPEKKKKKVAKV